MTVFADSFDDSIVTLIKEGGVGVIRTDTLYGIVARADNEMAVERMYEVKGRTPTKPPIVLIGSTDQLLDQYHDDTLERLHDLWPAKTSIILPAVKAPAWLTRGSGSLAYRIPDNEQLRQLLSNTGPLIAPSANPEGEHPAMTISEARAYFGDMVDFYVDGGIVTDDTPSKLYRLQADGSMERLR